jgi:hypothetical protein
MITAKQINNFVLEILGQTIFMLGCYNDLVLEDRYICLTYNHVIYIRDTEANKDYMLEVESDPYVYIKNHKLFAETRVRKYYDLLGNYYSRKISSKNK